MQEESNSESTFEFVDNKKSDGELRDSFSSRSSSASLLGIPVISSDSSLTASPGAGNMLSAVAPPLALPSFVRLPDVKQHGDNPRGQSHGSENTINQTNAFIPTTFSAAIPSSVPVQITSAPQPSQTIDQRHTDDASAPEKGAAAGLFGWVKGAVSHGGILHKVAEKAKSSVDTMITTLDPQMREFIHSGGDMDILVASDKEVKISPVREAFQIVFGKATVIGLPAACTTIAAQPVGYESALVSAKERIASVRENPRVGQLVAVVAVENYVAEIGGPQQWFDISLLYLTDPVHGISLQCLSQATPIAPPIITAAKEDTPPDYKHRNSGFAVTIGSLMAANLQVHHTEWHQALTGVSRRDIILLAARSLAGLYKNALSSQN